MTKVIICKTIRNKFFLPLSSRNNLLNKKQILKSSFVSKSIRKLFFLIKKILKTKIK